MTHSLDIPDFLLVRNRVPLTEAQRARLAEFQPKPSRRGLIPSATRSGGKRSRRKGRPAGRPRPEVSNVPAQKLAAIFETLEQK